MRYGAFWRGIDLRNPKLTRKPQYWAGYFGWWVCFNLHALFRPYHWPKWFWRRLYRADVPHDKTTWVRYVRTFNRVRSLLEKPFRKLRGPYAHRCDWTDPEGGILYGGDGETMNAMFDQLIENISPTPEQEAEARFAVDDLHRRLTKQPTSKDVN